MKRFIGTIAILILGLSTQLQAQQPQRPPAPPEVEAERLRIEAQERARHEMEQKDWDTKIFQLKYADPRELRQVLSMFRAAIQDNPSMRVLSVRAPKEIMPAIEDTIKRFDVPSVARSADLTIYVLLASDQADSTKALPQALQPVINQLKAVFAYKNFQVIDTLSTHGVDGRGTNLRGVLPPFGNIGQPSDYQFAAMFQIDTPDQKEPVLRLRSLNFNARVPIAIPPGNFRMSEVGIATDVDIPRGQQVVVGKATVGDAALILVMNAKF